MSSKRYLGDGVYADWDGMHIVLATDTVPGSGNRIYLDSSVFDALVRYAREVAVIPTLEPLLEEEDDDGEPP